MNVQLIFSAIGVIVLLVVSILKFKIHPFISLLIASILIGVLSGLTPEEILESVTNGMGGTLGFVATIVGLGSIFGGILESSGGVSSLASWLVKKIGFKNAPWAMLLSGFLIAIPVFFDVAFIILLPMAMALRDQTKKQLVLYAMPLLAGLAIAHTFIPPTPGPVAVADILGVELGWVILIGIFVGLPTAFICGPPLAKRFTKHISIDRNYKRVSSISQLPNPIAVLIMIVLPISLVVIRTVMQEQDGQEYLATRFSYLINIIGHPFSALLLANLSVWYFLGIRRGISVDQLFTISSKSLVPAGGIILLTGAGGAFKQSLIDSGIGVMIAESINLAMFPPFLIGFVVSAVVRLLQGSATVAMVTGAGIMAPILLGTDISQMQKAVLVISIASGASVFSHVNDSGFWLVKEYLGLTEKQTFQTWTVMTTLIALSGLFFSTLIWYVMLFVF
ncbi:GntP family permease [Reichenbachiella versicolor]|uniref:GntP family permease n=1 Tax=Reichenbachiella versicolor TaxID=1821036 RepID=UPI000D6E3269|nr:gluconate:H+ symporter [Reichenbachiella versicolor]